MNSSTQTLRVGIVAGESSGDTLGAALIAALRARVPNVQVFGVAGPKMIAAGCEPWESSDELAVMGLVEVLKHLPRLLSLRKSLLKRFTEAHPDVFIGIDAPEFNLGLEKRLKSKGLRTVQYVSPQVWAWRQGRVRTIGQAADLVLCLLPFETEFYAQHGVHAEFVGHPLADQIPLDIDRDAARRALGLDASATVVALLPGSRMGEVERLGTDFIAAAAWIAARKPGVRFIAPMATRRVRDAFERQLAAAGVAVQSPAAAKGEGSSKMPARGNEQGTAIPPGPPHTVDTLRDGLPTAAEGVRTPNMPALGNERGVAIPPGLPPNIEILDGQAQRTLAAADGVIVASGTATLETLLSKRPMVVAYRLGAVTAFLLKRLGLVKVPYFSQPNLLLGRRRVPEFFQEQVSGAALGEALLKQIEDPAQVTQLQAEFRGVHEALRRGGAERAADAILEYAGHSQGQAR